MDPSQYSNRRGGLTLAQLLDEIEKDDIHQPLDIYAEPPDDGQDTECDTDDSDDEHEGNLNHLGPRMLRTQCECVIRDMDKDDTEFDSSDEEPLSKYCRTTDTADAANRKSIKNPKKSIIKWKKAEPNFNINRHCLEKPPSAEAVASRTPLEFFQLFFTNQLIDNMLEQTNLYSSQKNNFLNVTKDEIMVVIGGLLLSGYAKYPNKRMFWSENDDVPTILKQSIRLNRLEQILRHFHLNDNSKIDPEDRLYKLRPLINELNEKFQMHGGLLENISIDESMIPYYGRHYAKQYIRGKPIRFGFKNWALCNSNGYMISFEIYTGKNDKEKKFGIGGDVVVSLIASANIPPNEGFKIYFDNYFSSIALFQHLTSIGYCATGTIQDGRTAKCPLINKADMLKKERGVYDYRCDSNNTVCLVRWKDNKVVTCATNFDYITEGKCYRWSKEKKTKIAVPQPQLFAQYNAGMGGVDKMDQLVACYRTRMRQKKWWWPIFCYLLDVSITNAWLLMKQLQPNSKDCASLLVFRRYIAVTLLSTYGKPSHRGKTVPNPNYDIRYDGRDHWPEYVNTERMCRFCGGKSKFTCSKCKLGLHPKTCFKSYHTF